MESSAEDARALIGKGWRGRNATEEKRFPLWLALGGLFVSVFVVTSLDARDHDHERRSRAGVLVFQRMLAADQNIRDKADPLLHIVVYYRSPSEEGRARGLAAELSEKQIKTLTVRASAQRGAGFARPGQRRYAAVYFAEPPPKNDLERLIHFGVSHRIIVFSPFPGHVEMGVLGGLSTEAQVRPYINGRTLERSRIELQSLFLDTSKVLR